MKLLNLVFLISNLLFFIYPTSGQVQIVVDASQKKHTISPMIQGGLEIASLWSTQWPDDADSDFRFLVSSSNHYEPTPTAEFFKLYAHALNGVLVYSISADSKVMTAAVLGKNNSAIVYVLNKNAVQKAMNISITGLDIQSVEQVLCFQEPGITKQIDFQQTGTAGCSFDAPGYSLSMVEFSFDNGTSDRADNEVSQIHIYPNPVSDRLTFSSGSIKGNTIINLYDVAGRVVFTDAFQPQLTPQYSISTGSLSPGYYLMSLRDDSGKQFSAKILKN